MRTDTKDLLPCPFCGSTDAVRLDDGDSWDFLPDGEPVTWAVVCDYNRGGCGGSGGFRDSKKDAIAAWNQVADRLAEVAAQSGIKADTLRRTANKALPIWGWIAHHRESGGRPIIADPGRAAMLPRTEGWDVFPVCRVDDAADRLAALEEELASLRTDRDGAAEACRMLQEDKARLEQDNARLREALEDIRSLSFINLAMQPNPLTLTAMLGDIHQIADAALEQEDTQ